MERVLQNIEPKEVLAYFEDLSRIPRESGNEMAVTDYLISFAKEHGLKWYRDDFLNVLIRKKATRGYENRPGVILQGHTDMVCEKNGDTVHDFTKDPIKLVVEGDRITADGTTLGADDGIGIAIALAFMADEKSEHPDLELLCTSDEERGMGGVEGFDVNLLKGRILINLDADDEGVFVVGCAGGPAVRTEIPVTREEVLLNRVAMRVEVRNLKGGHSGEDIHRGRANSIKLMGRILMALEREVELQLVDITGGLKYNAIPREAEALIYVKNEDVEKAQIIVGKMQEIFRNEYYLTDKDVTLNAIILHDEKNEFNGGNKPLNKASLKALINYVCFAETGIVRMNMELKDTVESSVSLGVIRMEKDKVIFETLTRSSIESVYMEMYYKLQRLAESVGGETILMSNCPEWEYNPDSYIKSVFEETYKRMYGKDPEIWILHAGLECGVFKKKIFGAIDMIAAGPDVRDLHTPGEYFTISSLSRFWDFFREAMKSI